jgi:hypothetical protein
MTTPMVGASLTAPPTPLPQQIPRLENGDRLTRDEFERRYAAMPHVKQAELLEGIVHMPSPVRIDQHGRSSAGWRRRPAPNSRPVCGPSPLDRLSGNNERVGYPR